MSAARISRWLADGRLIRLHPGVYAVGHLALPAEGWLVAAALYGGPGAMLSHETAAWWWQLTEDEPAVIDVSAPGRRRSLPGVRVHHPRVLQGTHHRRLPLTTIARTLLDYGATAPGNRVRRALAEADYRGLLNNDAIGSVLGRGRPGSRALSAALEHHLPRLALTRSALEQRFLALCESERIPLPEVNPIVEGLMVDALWRRERVIAELDGHAGHRSHAQIERDRRRELVLRRAGFTVVRYTWRQITYEVRLVAADLRALLGRRAPGGEPVARRAPLSRSAPSA